MRFLYPELFLLLLLVPVFLWVWVMEKQPFARFRYSMVSVIKTIDGAVSMRPVWIPRILRLVSIILVVLAAARPQEAIHNDIIKSRGVDIILALDISGSMRALDFQPKNRLEMAKLIMSDFIDKREHDRIGLVLFGSESFTLCPLTLDHDLLKEFLSMARIGMVEEQTAIGKAIANGVNRLRIDHGDNDESNADRAKSQILILCTDGVNNVSSKMDPITAAKAAGALGIKIYTIGVGTNGYVDFPDPRFRGRTVKLKVELDEDTLKDVAKLTDGQYFHALNTEALQTIFEIIDKMETVEVESIRYTRYNELFAYFLIPAFIVLLIEVILRQSIYRRIP